ncbi:type IV fimbrial biogenesis protein FimT [Methylomarinovum caldicuralii]|uniref:Type II secretion system protein H n=1 Tax=Methylomarinovum caldicuralii TaxID=438856 RepID=A0AAU9C978_9GAMM|nr:GspH/FimT family pseudopilin [Methylomarinovum caldicuralii]BCX81034.1 type IV fimbrial biogenesis protein FimT [Methylomarinovum caldicuralii]
MFSRATGFTLIELMVTVAMAAIVLTVGVPGFQALVKNNRLTAAANELVGTLSLARSEAVKRGIRVTVCKSADGESCATSGYWEQGWIVFTDLNSDGAFADNGDSTPCESGEECILRVHGALPDTLTLRTGSNFSNWISYLPSGISRGNGGLANGTFRLCHGTDTADARSIAINTTGRVSVTKGASTCP